MAVMSARVHDAWAGRRIRFAGLFLDRERIHVGPERDARAGLLWIEGRDDACTRDAGFDGHPWEVGEAGCYRFGRALLVVSQFGMSVKIMSECDEFIDKRVKQIVYGVHHIFRERRLAGV
jgi:hypothetical protein